MKIQSQNQNSDSKSLIALFLIICSWFYFNIYLGYLLSKIFYNFIDNINKTNFCKSIKFRKKFNFKNIIKIIIDFFYKLIKNWFIRIGQKFLLLMDAIHGLIIGVQIFRKKFKSILKFKHNFRLLKNLLLIFWETFSIYCSLINEILFLNHITNWVIQWRNIIGLLMKESVFITRIVYSLYLILLGIFGILLGFLLGVYRRKDEIYVFYLILLLRILYNSGFDHILLETLEPRNIEEFSKFSLQVCESSNSRASKLFLGELVKNPQIPFPLLGEPSISIDVDFLFEESINYEFDLFKFYINQKVKS